MKGCYVLIKLWYNPDSLCRFIGILKYLDNLLGKIF